jgi:cytochrome c553
MALSFLVACSVLEETPEPVPASTEESSSTSWYNMPGFEPIFGDFGPASGDTPRDREVLQAFLKRGEHLTKNVAACGSCHAMDRGNPQSPLAGGAELRDEISAVRAANITSDKDTGIGRWTVPAIVRAIRSSIDRDGKPLSLELHRSYRWMSNEDATAIALYLRTTRPVRNEVERRKLGGLDRTKYLVIPKYSEIVGYVPRYQPSQSAGYGWYVTNVMANCAGCHSSLDARYSAEDLFKGSTRGRATPGALAGIFGAEPEADAQAIDYLPAGGPNIRGKEGLNEWSESDIVEYLRTGKGPDGTRRNGKLCPWPYFKGMDDVDLRAVANFLKRL